MCRPLLPSPRPLAGQLLCAGAVGLRDHGGFGLCCAVVGGAGGTPARAACLRVRCFEHLASVLSPWPGLG